MSRPAVVPMQVMSDEMGIQFSRSDAFTFYCLATTSFLESAVPIYVANLFPIFDHDPAVRNWLHTVWLPEEAEHGRLARAYVERVWPEFDWERGYGDFLRSYTPLCHYRRLRPTPALEALARCVTETEATMMYRCLEAYTSDPDLKRLMRTLSRDEAHHYAYFKRVFDRYDAAERNSRWRTVRTVLARNELVRDADVAVAFRPLNACWSGDKPFRSLEYHEFLSRAGTVMRRHFRFDQAKQMLFRPLRKGGLLERLLVEIVAAVMRRQYSNSSISGLAAGALPMAV